jgi:hypothetical protein
MTYGKLPYSVEQFQVEFGNLAYAQQVQAILRLAADIGLITETTASNFQDSLGHDVMLRVAFTYDPAEERQMRLEVDWNKVFIPNACFEGLARRGESGLKALALLCDHGKLHAAQLDVALEDLTNYGARETAPHIVTTIVIPTLLRALEHKSPIVREGALVNLEVFDPTDEVRTKLQEVAKNDSSKAVREIAQRMLDDDEAGK